MDNLTHHDHKAATGRRTLLFVADRPPEKMEPYMAVDLAILGRTFDVQWHDSVPRPAWRPFLGPAGWLPSTELLRRVRSAAAVFQWFAYPAAPIIAARLLGRRCLLVAGGYDVAAVPSIGYGQMLHRRTRWMSRLALQLADEVLALSESARTEIRRWSRRANVKVVYPGLDPTSYPLGDAKRLQVATVGAVCESYLRRKGLDVFAQASRLLPHVDFVLVGALREAETVANLRALGGANLRLTGHLDHAGLVNVLKTSAAYVQASLHEGFGYAVAEAMLCVLTPVTSGAGALREVVGAFGLLRGSLRPRALAQGIAPALRQPNGRGAREYIETHFSLEARAAAITRALA